MQRSIYLARLIGPVAVAIGVGLLFNAAVYRVMAVQFLGSTALIYLSGILAMTAGIAVILAHNIWVGDWRVIITLFGWLAAIGGTFRIIIPDQIALIGQRVIDTPNMAVIGGLIVVVLGGVLSYYGYADTAPAKPSARKRRK
jgi:hypothetical protein